jgi:hypothetical protein
MVTHPVGQDLIYQGRKEAKPETPINEKQKPLEFLTLDPKQIAFQLTLKDHEMLCGIRPLQFLLRLWAKDGDPIIAQEITAINDMVAHFNKVRTQLIMPFLLS